MDERAEKAEARQRAGKQQRRVVTDPRSHPALGKNGYGQGAGHRPTVARWGSQWKKRFGQQGAGHRPTIAPWGQHLRGRVGQLGAGRRPTTAPWGRNLRGGIGQWGSGHKPTVAPWVILEPPLMRVFVCMRVCMHLYVVVPAIAVVPTRESNKQTHERFWIRAGRNMRNRFHATWGQVSQRPLFLRAGAIRFHQEFKIKEKYARFVHFLGARVSLMDFHQAVIFIVSTVFQNIAPVSKRFELTPSNPFGASIP